VTEGEDEDSDLLAYDTVLINIYRSSWGHVASIFRASAVSR